MLSNWYYVMGGIETEDGLFCTIEGYWFWLGTTAKNRDVLRKVSGKDAKEIGPKMRREETNLSLHLAGFQTKIRRALRDKVKALPGLYYELKASVLPFEHYYSPHDDVKPAGHKWLVEEWEKIRDEIKRGVL